MKARGVNGRSPAELVVCFPSGGHLSLMPKPMYGPSRPIKPLKRLHPSRPTKHYGPAQSGIKPKHVSSEGIDEPTSPKVTCAGQIKVRPNTKPKLRPKSKNWLYVAKEMERLQKHFLHLLSSLGSLRFSMKCFGSFDNYITDEEDVEEDDDHGDNDEEENDGFEEEPSPPPSTRPPNALYLMRSKSQPSKGWVGEDDEETSGRGEEMSGSTSVKMIREEGGDDEDDEEEKKLILMRYGPDFYKLSMDIAKETWVVGSADPLGRSRSWKR
uniref:Uncharacterized protein n=1 Tax=Ananas comosus var. bracteatus TaxID=296719 RepID=A0A6V7P6A5_ANACO|nr:unnamed protein product [Ananas comosus var. bracteatus]